MSKKILSLVLSLIIIAGFVVQPVQAKGLFPYDSLIFGEDFGQSDDSSGIIGEDVPAGEQFTYEMEIKTVVGLGWMSQLQAGEYNQKDFVTKYDVYESLINMMKGPDATKTIDVSGDNVTFEELSDIFINNLALNPYVPKDSTFFAAGSMVGLFKGMKGITKDAFVTREQLAKVMYNSLKIKQYEAQIGKTPIVYEEGATVAENLGLQIMEGVVTGNEYINLYSDAPLEEGYVAVNRFVVKDETLDAKTLLGKKVTAYINNLDDEPTLLFAYREEANPKSDIQISTDEYITSGSTSLVYDAGNKNKTINLNPNARVLLNGRYLGQLSGVDISAYTVNPGTIQTVDTSDDDRADVILITVYNTWVVESIYAVQDDFIIANGLTSDVMRYDENATYYFVKNGEMIDVTGVAKDDVLYISESAGSSNKLYMIYVGSEKLEGDILSVGNGTITVAEQELKLIKNFAETIEFKPVKVYLGYDGKVAHIEYKKETAMQYGYIMSLTCNTEEVDEGVMYMRVFTMDGKETKYESAEKIRFQDGAAVTSTVGDVTIEVPTEKRTPKYVYDQLVAQGKYMVIQFGLDAEGKISKIATAVDSTSSGRIYENVFSKDLYSTERIRFYNKYLGPRFKRSGKMNYMVVPSAQDRKGDIKYYSVKSVPTDQSMTNVEFYDSSSNGNMVGGLIVRYVASASASLTGSCGAGIVKEVSLAYDEAEGSVNYKITIVSRDGEEVNATVSQDNINFVNAGRTAAYSSLTVADLQKGDVILYAVDSLGALTAFNVEIRAAELSNSYYEKLDEGSPSITSNLAAILTAYTQVLGTETMSNGDVIFSGNTGVNTVTVDGVAVPNPLWNRSYHVPKKRAVLVYDRETGEITKGTGADIVKGDNIFVQTNYDYIKQTYIIVR